MSKPAISMYSRKYWLGVRGNGLKRRLVDLTDSLSDAYDLADVVFDDSPFLPVGCGRTSRDVFPNSRSAFLCLIGSKNMPGLLQRVDDVTVLDAFVSVYHEFEHVRQVVEYETCDDDASLGLCIDDAASRGNSLHYRQNHNRYRFELQAERDALKHLQSELPLLFSKKDASDLESCLLWYVNQKAQFDKVHPLYCGQSNAYDSSAREVMRLKMLRVMINTSTFLILDYRWTSGPPSWLIVRYESFSCFSPAAVRPLETFS